MIRCGILEAYIFLKDSVIQQFTQIRCIAQTKKMDIYTTGRQQNYLVHSELLFAPFCLAFLSALAALTTELLPGYLSN